MVNASDIAIDNDLNFIKSKFSQFTYLKTIGVGDSFGEQALRTNLFRNATVVAKRDCKLAYLSKAAF